MTITRRSLIGLSLAVAAGCKLHSSPKAPHVDPDAAALGAARTSELALISAYDAAIATSDSVAAGRLSAERAVHAQHLAALGGTAPVTDATAPPPSTRVRGLLSSSANSLRGSAVTAVDGANAALFASIAASHDVMLRD